MISYCMLDTSKITNLIILACIIITPTTYIWDIGNRVNSVDKECSYYPVVPQYVDSSLIIVIVKE